MTRVKNKFAGSLLFGNLSTGVSYFFHKLLLLIKNVYQQQCVLTKPESLSFKLLLLYKFMLLYIGALEDFWNCH